MGPAIVEMENVGLRPDGGGEILSDLTLALARGEFLAVTGAPGTGKSLLLALAAGELAPDRGRVRLFGEGATARRRPWRRRRIGAVGAAPPLVPELSVHANVALPLALRGIPRAEIAERTDEMLEWLALDGVAGRRPAALSGDERWRVALARAVIARPELLLVDGWPCTAADGPRATVLIERLTDLGGAILLVERDDARIASLPATRRLRLAGGRLRAA